ncbi:MAG: phosphoribosylformylglycinamidine synthase I [Chloroflexota bacterium]|nr:phosphoribosylformylglycinamidine synthase I [Anaerolineae bacterium]
MRTRPRVLILHAPGTNRDRETALACRLAGGEPEIVHINQLLAGEFTLNAFQLLVLPGGFSYADDLGGGRLWASDLLHRLRGDLSAFIAAGKPVLGICNGFQALVKAGFLPGGACDGEVTLTHNARGRFECRWVTLQPIEDSRCLWTRSLEEPIYCPVAHGEGRFTVKDERVRRKLWDDGLVALSYVAPEGKPVQFPYNPNGSVDGIAGICNLEGNVLGLMPHPEDHVYPIQHPSWTRGERGGLGLALFRSGLRLVREV